MGAVIEVRTYRAKAGMRPRLLALLESRAFPLQRNLGMKVIGPFAIQDDDVSFVWLRAFPDEASREPLKSAFYEGEDWLGGLEAEAMPMLDDYSAITLDDTADLWSRWPAEPRSIVTENADLPPTHFAVTLARGPAWDESVGIREQRDWDAHAAFMDSLVEDGLILLGGPLGDGSETLHAMQATDEAQIRQRLAEDPWARAGMLQVSTIEPWALWLDVRATTR